MVTFAQGARDWEKGISGPLRTLTREIELYLLPMKASPQIRIQVHYKGPAQSYLDSTPPLNSFSPVEIKSQIVSGNTAPSRDYGLDRETDT